MPDQDPVPPGEPTPDPLDERAFLEAEKIRAEAERLRTEAEQLKSRNKGLQAQVDELKSLSARNVDEEPPKDLQRLHLLQIQLVRDILVILLVLGVFWLGYVLRAITVPMLLALTLAYLVEPVVRRVVARGFMSRFQAAALVIMLAVVVITVPLTIGTAVAVTQGISYGQNIAGNIALVQRLVQDPSDEAAREALKRRSRAWQLIGETVAGMANPGRADEPVNLEAPPMDADPATPARVPAAPAPQQVPGAGVAAPPDAERQPSAAPPEGQAAAPPLTIEETHAPGGPRATAITDWLALTFEQNLQGIGRVLGRYLLGTGAGAVDIGFRTLVAIGYLIFATFLVLFFFFFFCTGYERVSKSFSNLIPTWKRQRTLNLLSQMDAVIAGFVRGRLIIMGILMVMFTVGFWLIGVPGALIIGPITGVLGVVPYLGLISIPTAMLLMWLQPVGFGFQQTWWWILFAPVVTYFAIQLFEDYVLTPAIQGKTTQMDVPSILFAVLAGGILAGFYGILLAIPAAACIKILLRETFWPRFAAWADGRVKDFLPISRYDPTETDSTPQPERRE